MLTRRTTATVIIEGKDITKDIEPYLLSVSYTDVLEGESNTAQISLHVRERLFIADWFPKRGDSAEISLSKLNWSGESDSDSVSFGIFEIDEIENKVSGSGNTASIKLNSIANKSELRSIDKSRSWEKVKLSKIATDLTQEAGLELFFDADDVDIERAEQKETSNLKFLHKLCKDNGLCLRVSNGKVIIFDAERYEAKDAVTTLTYGDENIISFSGKATISKIYKSARVKYQHGKQAEKFDYKFDDPEKSDGMTLEINQKVDNQAEAEKLAKKKLKEKNREEITVNLSVIGDFIYLAGQTLELKDFGFYDGRYMIKKVTHSVGKGYTCSLEMYKCVTSY
ncbi:MAG: hypothetical protein IJG24_09865 [Selenomonadaceae bacterium]|nr:hypothetical protein [Selenomonadaceae bacterium]